MSAEIGEKTCLRLAVYFLLPLGDLWPSYLLTLSILSKVSQRKTDHSCVESNFTNETNKLIYKTGTNSQILKTNLCLLKGETWRGGIN